MQSDSLGMGLVGFYSYLFEKLKNFRKLTTNVMAMFGSGFMCVNSYFPV